MGSADEPPTTISASTEPSARRLRAVLRWLPLVISALVLVGATGAVVQLGRVPAAAAPDGDPAVDRPRPEVPILSVRRDLEPLRRAAADRRLRTEIDAFVASQPPDTCVDVRVGDLRHTHRADDPQSPASLQKLLVAVAVLEEFGPDATFSTEVLAVGSVSGGVVTGDLFLRGAGDPLLSTDAYAARFTNQPQLFTPIATLAEAVQAAGITQISGTVVGDESRYDTVRYNPAWPPRFVDQDQTGPLSALSVNDGFAVFPPTGSFGLEPATDPAAHAAEVLAAELGARGVAIGAPPRSGSTPPEATVVATLPSLPVSDIVAEMLKESDNTTAELLVKELGVRRSGIGSFEAGRTAIASILGEVGLAAEPLVVTDGSGLAMENQVTCDLVVDLLDHAPTSDAVREGLAIAGVDGTLKNRFAETEVAGKLRGKTGTLNQVTALAGVADTAGGDIARFGLVVNLPETEIIQAETVAAQQRLAELLVRHPQLPDVDHLRPRR